MNAKTHSKAMHSKTMHSKAGALALIAGVAALAGCSTSGQDAIDNTERTGGITQAVAVQVDTTATGVTDPAVKGERNALAGEQVVLALTAPGTNAAGVETVPGTATLVSVGAGATPELVLEQVGTRTIAANGPGNATGVALTQRTYGTAAAGSTPGAPALDPAQDQLVVIDAQYARIAAATLAPDPAVGGRAGRAFTSGPFDPAVQRPTVTTGSATYVGQAQAAFVSPQSGIEDVDGTVELRADFAAGRIEGEVDFDGTRRVLLRDGTFRGADYAGDATIVDPTGATTYTASGGRGAFRGGVFGPGAEETAGVFDFQGTATDAAGRRTRVDALGNYIARDDSRAVPVPAAQP